MATPVNESHPGPSAEELAQFQTMVITDYGEITGADFAGYPREG